ncbi:MAG: phenylalanine--tRNA ligase subunit beta [Candidatus ainarchaeum sp.]|nr:phenylalanine--tRNA ligase subunit beta [Candidatus ainarchaeum sp.]
MAVVTISIQELKKLTGLDKKDMLEQLSETGMPAEEGEGVLFVEVTPNRPDFFSIEGIVRTLNHLAGKAPRAYSMNSSEFKLVVDRSVGKQRPYAISTVLKNVDMDEDVLKSMIQLQEKLHETVGRKRKKVAIGMHNADAVTFPLTYKFVKNASFVPLDFSEEMDVQGVLAKHPKGQTYAHLVGPQYPMLCDQQGVISFPPIINSERTRVTAHTRNLVLDVTGTHQETLIGVLNILVCALADRGGEIYGVATGTKTYPELSWPAMPIKLKEITKLLGEKISKEDVQKHLARMGWRIDAKGNALVPPYRMDVSHYADMAEDIAISYGYNNFKPTLPGFFSIGSPNRAEDEFRDVMVGAGFLEMVNYVLTNQEKIANTKALKIINPKTEDFTLIRTALAASLLENIASNKTQEHPLKIFEIGRVYDVEVGEELRLGFAMCSDDVDFSVAKGMLQTLMQAKNAEIELKGNDCGGLFIAGRGALIHHRSKKIGLLGEVSPEILEKMKIDFPVCICEVNLKALAE